MEADLEFIAAHYFHKVLFPAASYHPPFSSTCTYITGRMSGFCSVITISLDVLYDERNVWQNMNRDMRYPTMWYVRPAKPQNSLRICAV